MLRSTYRRTRVVAAGDAITLRGSHGGFSRTLIYCAKNRSIFEHPFDSTVVCYGELASMVCVPSACTIVDLGLRIRYT